MAGHDNVVQIPDDVHAIIRDAVAEGNYVTEADVISEAVQVWRQNRREERLSEKELRDLWEQGLSSGPGEPLDVERIKREGRRRLEQNQAGGI